MRTRRGSIIAFSVILLSILLTSGLSVVTVATLEKKSGLSTQKSVVAFQAADSGIERVLKRIYIDNSPTLSTSNLNDPMPDVTLQQVAAGLQGVTGALCNVGSNKIVATSSNEPTYTFEASFFDGSDVQIACSDTEWRDKVVRLKVEGFYRQTSRVIELGIEPRKKCSGTDTVTDDDGNVYGVIQIGDQCWMQQNMRVGTMINAPTSPTNNGVIEKYCYNNQASNCTSNHPNEPDGGLYTWDEAMQYSRNEGAQGICPHGWHIPTRLDWYTLYHELDPSVNNPNAMTCVGTDIGFKLPPGGSSGFEKNFAGVHDSTAFGGRNNDPTHQAGHYWSSTERPSAPATEALSEVSLRVAGNNQQTVCRQYWLKEESYSVRCVKD